ncbi:MAG: portal protein [Casimicrobium sp.]
MQLYEAARESVDSLDENQDLVNLLVEELEDCREYIDVVVGPERERALNYYLRRKRGDERKGRSTVQSADVFKVVEGLSTSISDMFLSKDKAVEFCARRQAGVQEAEQRTALVNYVFYTQNNGFLNIHEAIKDGLLSKTGFLTWRWEKDETVTEADYKNQTQESLQSIVSDDPGSEILSVEPAGVEMQDGGDGQQLPVELFNARVRSTQSQGRVVVECLDPADVLVSPRAKSCDLQKAPTVAIRWYASRDELMSQGYDEELVSGLSFSRSRYREGDSGIRRTMEDESSSPNAEEVLIYRIFRRIDLDGDGVPELRCIYFAEQDKVILKNEIVDEVPVSAWTPTVLPHEFVGRCPADEAVESQDVSTVLRRQTLDNLYWANNPMLVVDTKAPGVSVEDFTNPSMGRALRAPKDAVSPIVMPFVAQHSFPMLEFIEADTENKTGWTRYAQGMDGDTLNQTARGISIITNMSQLRAKSMARLFGEMCLAPCMRGIARLLSQHAERPLSMRLSGQFVEVDPREWKDEFDMQVNVGVGMMDKEQIERTISMTLQNQATAINMGGLDKIVTLKNIYSAHEALLQNAGIKDVAKFWTDPANVPKTEPQPDPEQLKAQHEQQIAQVKAQVDMQIAQLKAQADAEVAIQKAQIEAQTKLQIEQMKQQTSLAQSQMAADAASKPATAISFNAAEVVGPMAEAMIQSQANSNEAISAAMQMLSAAIQQMNQNNVQIARILSADKEIVRDSNGRAVRARTILEEV